MIKIKNAYENNLKNISLNIPKNKIISIIGVSGSGKSTLIYNVLANEAKRREKIDSGNASCLDYAVRAKFDSIDNLPYCIALKQRGLQQSISSTLATATRLHELLREEFAQYGDIVGGTGNTVSKPNPKNIQLFIEKYYPKEKLQYYAIVCFQKYTDGKNELDVLKKNNIKEIMLISSFDNKERIKKVSTLINLNPRYHYTILVPFDNINDICSYKDLAIESFLIKNKKILFNFNFDYPDLESGKIYQKKSTQLLSFNSTHSLSGKCQKCNGHGIIEDIELESLILKNKKLNSSFLNLEENSNGCYKYVLICMDTLKREFDKHQIDSNKTFFNLSTEKQHFIKDILQQKIIKHKTKPSIGKFVKNIKCPSCNGTRLNYKANAVKLYSVNISEILDFTVDELYDFLKDKTLHHKKILTILKSLQNSTLGYLSLNRTTDTLSGGELQRLKFATELNSEYKNLLYILDEPSTGLHPYNNYQMINLIQNLKNKENTVIVSEHNHAYIDSSDYIVELGYGSGEAGGQVVFSGGKKEFENIEYSRNKLSMDLKNSIELTGVTSNNVINENFSIPLNCLVAISGISGSGKSSLIHKVLVPTVKQYLADKTFNNSLVKRVNGLEKIKSIIELTQSQIGINSRSIVATYLNIFDNIRDIFSEVEIAKEFGFDRSYFSFNSSAGACENCKGLGEVEDLICPSCLGQRYKAEVLEIRYKGLHIFEVLSAQIDKLNDIFDDVKLQFAFEILQKLGLSHITLGRTTPTLSGGEAQRLKLAKTLIDSFHKIKNGNFLFVLDEPTTGLNDKDIAKLYAIFDEILSFNNSIIIIEHNLNIIRNSDFIIDIGVGSGKNGGKNLFSGSFKELLEHKTSLTARAFHNDFAKIESFPIDKSDLFTKFYQSKKEIDCNEFYLDDRHFRIEKDFAKNHQVTTDNNNHKYFKEKEDLFDYVNKLDYVAISFNPYVSELFKYRKVPLTIKKEKIKHLKKLGFEIGTKDFEKDEWGYRVEIDNIDKAYNFGNGWITVKTEETIYELFTRLVSIKNKIIGTPRIDEKTFNLYLNSCVYCDGSFSKDIYDGNLIIADKSKSITEEGFSRSNIKFNLKSVITKFQKELLFDFTQPFNKLSEEEKNIFLFGFREYKFLKPKGRINAIGDYIRWQGLYFYIYNDLNKIKIADEIQKSQHTVKCPFCKNGFKNEINFYTNKGQTILASMHNKT